MNGSTTISIGLALSVSAPIFGALLGLNIFFLRKLVDKIDQTACAMPKILAAIEGFDRRQGVLEFEVRELKRLEARVSYLEGILKALTAAGVESGASTN